MTGWMFSQYYTAVGKQVLEMACQNLPSYWWKVCQTFAKGCRDCFLRDKHPSIADIYKKKRKRSKFLAF